MGKPTILSQNRIFSSDLTKEDRAELAKPYRKWFSRRLKAAQKERAMKNPQLCERLGVSAEQLAKYRRGDNWADFLQVARIAQILNKPFNYFIHPDFRRQTENEFFDLYMGTFEEGSHGPKEVAEE